MSEQPVDDPQKLGVAQTWDFWDEARTLILDSPLSEAAKQRLIDGLGPEPPRDGRIALDAEGDHVLAPGAHLVPLLPPDREPELAADDGMEINEDAGEGIAGEGTLEITRTSIATGITRSIELPITPEQLERWRNGELIQDAMPHLSDAEREFVLSGMTAEEWAEFRRMEEEMDRADDDGDGLGL
jgi:hypothetical protein